MMKQHVNFISTIFLFHKWKSFFYKIASVCIDSDIGTRGYEQYSIWGLVYILTDVGHWGNIVSFISECVLCRHSLDTGKLNSRDRVVPFTWYEMLCLLPPISHLYRLVWFSRRDSISRGITNLPASTSQHSHGFTSI